MVTKKVLIISGQEFILERNDGGKIASYRNYQLLKSVFGEENVYLCMMTNNGLSNQKNIFRLSTFKTWLDRGINILAGKLFTDDSNEKEIVSYIARNRIDIVFFERSMFGSIINKIKTAKLNCEIWIFMHNIEKNYFMNKVKHQNIFYYIPYLIIAKSEKNTISEADYIMTLTHRDSELLKRIYNRSSDLILPMTFFDTFEEKRALLNGRFGNEKNILFIGTMFPPNYDGIKWFVNNVMSKLPECELTIVGKGFEYKKKELERSNVNVVGYVENVEEYYYCNNIMVMPIFYGDGMKIKTAEAMMYGKIILASDEALEGYDVNNVDDIYRCNTVEDYLNTIRSVFEKKVHSYSVNVRNLFCSKYSLDNQILKCRELWNIS